MLMSYSFAYMERDPSVNLDSCLRHQWSIHTYIDLVFEAYSSHLLASQTLQIAG